MISTQITPLSLEFNRFRESFGLRNEVIQRDGATCRCCGKIAGKIYIEFVTPLSRGGRIEIDNLVLACASCEFRKSSETRWNLE